MAHELIHEVIGQSLRRLEVELAAEIDRYKLELERVADQEKRIAGFKERIGAYRLFLGLVPAQDQ